MATYEALVGLSLPGGRRVEAGEVTDRIPSDSIGWLTEAGKIRLVSGAPSDLDSMTKAQLREVAAQAGAEVPATATKAELRAAIDAAPGADDDPAPGAGDEPAASAADEPAESEVAF